MARQVDEVKVEITRMAQTLRSKVAEDGVARTAEEVGTLLKAHAAYPATRRRRQSARVTVGDRQLPYSLSRYNHTWLNERTLEIAVALDVVRGWPAGRLLEVGNVLGHYGLRGHDVVDLYEHVDGVINADIVSWTPDQPFDAVVAVSTLEHVRFDEPQKDPRGSLQGLEGMRRALRPGGRMLVTVPLGYNPGLDDDVRSGAFRLPEQHFMKRVNADNDWREVSADEALACTYGSVYRNANAVLIGIDPGTP